ncbi:MAG: glycine cleavage system protein GcvH [Gammaproteobacteria bacterium]|nr:glycine cleavage system protein GcvH [Gammaproteobacteria bacterium]
MSNIPPELRYAKSHEWIRDEGDGTATVGITDHAQEKLGDLVFVELPEPGTQFTQGVECAVVESVKAASDIYSPVGGEVVAVNEELNDAPETVNDDPFGGGWIFKIKMSDSAQLAALLDADDYAQLLASEDH